MSETRGLRDRLEALPVTLREVRGELERTRRAAEERTGELEALLRQAQERESAQQARADELLRLLEQTRALLPPRPETACQDVRLVALMDPPPDPEEAALVISSLAGLPLRDARLRVRGTTPMPVATLPAPEARALTEALTRSGHPSATCDVRGRPDRARVEVRSFVVGEEGLEVTPVHGELRLVPYETLRLLVRGLRRITPPPTPELPPARPFRWVNGHGGVEHADRLDHYAWLYGDGDRLAFTEHTRFSGLAPKLPPTLAESLRLLMRVLPGKAPQLICDERLVQVGRSRLGLLAEGDSHEAVAELLRDAVEQGWRPAIPP